MWYFAIAFHLIVGPPPLGDVTGMLARIQTFRSRPATVAPERVPHLPAVLGHPFLWAEAHYRGRAIAGQLHSAIGSTRGFPSSIVTVQVLTIGRDDWVGFSVQSEAPSVSTGSR